MKVTLLDSAEEDLANLDHSVAERIYKRLQWLETHADEIRHKSLKGELSDFYKLRCGDYRIIYEIFDEEHVIVVHAIGHRKDIYE